MMKKVILILICLLLNISIYPADNIFYAKGGKNKKQVALTFDDGPGNNTKEILKILKEKDVKATFFLLGTSVKKRPLTVKDIYEQGHEIANHTYNHLNFNSYKKEEVENKLQEELLLCEQIIKDTINYKTKLVRFPYGFSKKYAKNVAEKNKYTIINWSFGIDWQKQLSYEELLEDYKSNIESGAIFLMHDLMKNSKLIKFLPHFIDDIKNKGYSIVTVSELLEIK